MLRELSTKNFRKLTDAHLMFEPGLSVIRAPNETGKTTALEAIAYALFGAKALRNPLADTVTWGQPESSLSVKLVIEVDGIGYTFTRSKAGAEVNWEVGGQVFKVTGQVEASNFAAKLLGADLGAAPRLMMANQGDLRGALTQGPKATMQMIETLADFDLLDRLVEAMSSKLLLGSPAMLEARLEQAGQALTSLESGVTAPDLDGFDKIIEDRRARAKEDDANLQGQLKPALDAAREAYEGARNAKRIRDMVVNDLKRAADNRNVHVEQKVQSEEKAKLFPAPEAIQALKHQIAQASDAEAVRLAFLSFSALPTPENYWEGDEESFNAEESLNQKDLAEAEKGAMEASGEMRRLEAMKVTASTCGFCGQDVSKFPDVAGKNAKLAEQIADLSGKVEEFRKKAQEFRQTLKDLKGVRDVSNPFKKFLQSSGAYVDSDYGFFPPRLAWKGPTPTGLNPDVAGLRSELAGLEKQVEDAAKARARAEALTATLTEDDEYLKRLDGQLAGLPEPAGVEDLHRAQVVADQACAEAQGRVYQFRHEAEKAVAEKAQAIEQWKVHQQRIDDAKKQISEIKEGLDKLAFNNNLLKKVKAARPMIADKLWNTVLAAVSTFFSHIRGERSAVTKEKDGFKINGEAVESLSGSALDVLGLAIRVALVKTFLPACPFMVLDEPAAACDADRSASLVGFLSASGFQQLLLVTHEEVSETFADNLVTL